YGWVFGSAARPTERPAPPTGGGLVTAAPERPLSFRVASCFTNLLLSAPTIGTKGLLEDWNWSTTVASMPDVHTPSNLMPELKMSFICWAAGSSDQLVKVSLTTLMLGYLASAAVRPWCRSVSAGTPLMPRISMMLPFPPSFLASQSTPRLPY